ncbi:MAG: prepilin-type N-terminal cleavage/methylation domain-containing protein [Phycisphaerae bacterium]|nr:prepilin-type N-terminal cleavage/methylation domain-containing protein [Phycisphaerae bacterium]
MSYGLPTIAFLSRTRGLSLGSWEGLVSSRRTRERVGPESGFTLVEVLIAVVLIGVAVAALLGANGAFTRVNAAGVDLTTSEFLIEQISESTVTLPVAEPGTNPAVGSPFGPESGETLAQYDDLDDFDGATFSPPIDAGRNPLADLAAFSQVVAVQNVQPADLDQVAADHSTAFVRVTVRILRNGQILNSASWIRARY